MRLVPERSQLPRLLAFLYLVIAVAGTAALVLWPDRVLRWAHCPLRAGTGWPCLTCGGTHAAVALARLRFGDALRESPLVTLAAVVFAVWVVWALAATLVPAWRREVVLASRERRALRFALIFALAGGWLYQILRLGIG